MKLQFSSDTFHKYLGLSQKATFRVATLSEFGHLDTMLKQDSSNVLALLCHDALFAGDARIGGTQPVSLITALALLDQEVEKEWLKVQGMKPLRATLKQALNALPTLEAKMAAEVQVRLIVEHREYFVIVTNTSVDLLHGVVRLAVVG